MLKITSPNSTKINAMLTGIIYGMPNGLNSLYNIINTIKDALRIMLNFTKDALFIRLCVRRIEYGGQIF